MSGRAAVPTRPCQAEPPRGAGPEPRAGISRRDGLAILAVAAASLGLSLFVVPHTGYASIAELFYYTAYNVVVGAYLGFHLFDRWREDGLARIALQGASALLLGTLANEALVEPFVFASGPVNSEGLYYGLTDTLWTSAMFLLIRFAEALRRGRDGTESQTESSPSHQAGDAACLFVRVAGGTRRLESREILYMAAERDFTRIVCRAGEHFVSESLKSLVARSAAFGVVRVHKSFAINLGRLERLTRTEAELGDHRIPVGRRYRAALAETWRSSTASLARP